MIEKTERISTFFDRIRMGAIPSAHPRSIVICGEARFTVLTSRLIRLEWSASRFEDRGTFAFPSRYAEPPEFSYTVDSTQLEIRTADLTLRYTNNGSPFNQNNLSIMFMLDQQPVRWTPNMKNTGNLRGTFRTLDQCADTTSLQEGLLSRDGWSLFDDSGSILWDLEQLWVEARPTEHKQDWYFFGYGHDYKAALADYVLFGGDIPLIPRYVLGGWWSRYWPYHADDLKQLVNDFEAHDIPLDVLVVDMDWHTPDGWTGYTWNRKLFPDPEAFLKWVHKRDLRVTLNLHPADGVQKHEAAYPEFAELLGRDPASGKGIQFSPANKQFMQHYFELLHHPLEDQGVDFWWVDWQQGESSEIKGLDPLPWLNHLHFQDSSRRGTRPMLYSRWGGLGNHRYPIGFSGDTYATWESLRFQTYFTPTAANVGYGWWSHDIGGHFGVTAPELYARWVQFGAVSPCLRLHSTNDPMAERRPWAFPEPAYEAAKAAFQFRYQLMPYLYSAARTASQHGLSLCYPMYYEYPDSEDAYLAREQYFLGDQLFVAPIVQPSDPETGLAPVDVWIPQGEWIDYTTLEHFTGPRWIRLFGDLNRIPMFVKAGGIMPMAPKIMRTNDFDGSHLVITAFPGNAGQFEFYEDDGTTEAYKHNDYEVTSIRSISPDERTFQLSIAPAEGFCSTLPKRRTIELRLQGVNCPEFVTVNESTHNDWTYDAERGVVTITMKNADRWLPLNIVMVAENKLSFIPHKNLAGALPDGAQSDGPWVHCIDYTIFEEAKQKLGRVIIAPPADGSPFSAEITWTLHKGATVISSNPIRLENTTSEHILHCPFADEGGTFSWNVSIDFHWHRQTIPYRYQSQAARPSINQWQMHIYNPEQHPLSIQDVALVAEKDWSIERPTKTLNLTQPFGVVLLEQQRDRLLAHESLAACMKATLVSPSEQTAVLYVQCLGDATYYLNGVELASTEPVAHSKLQPMLYSWMTPTHRYYALPLQKGNNQLVAFTRPNDPKGWWGLGATVFDPAGNVLLEVASA